MSLFVATKMLVQKLYLAVANFKATTSFLSVVCYTQITSQVCKYFRKIHRLCLWCRLWLWLLPLRLPQSHWCCNIRSDSKNKQQKYMKNCCWAASIAMSLRYQHQHQQEHVQQQTTTGNNYIKTQCSTEPTNACASVCKCVWVCACMWHALCIRMSHTSGAAEKLLAPCMYVCL